MSVNPTQRTDLKKIELDIARANKFVITWIVGSLIVYVIWFCLFNKNSISESPASWGVTGDFFGGILNPVVAYFAFYWLTKSVRLQKEELLETRNSLDEATLAQRDQANYANTSVRLDALSTLTNSIMSEVEAQRMQLQFLINQLERNGSGARNLEGKWLKQEEVFSLISEINQFISKRMAERYDYELEIKSLLEVHRKSNP